MGVVCRKYATIQTRLAYAGICVEIGVDFTYPSRVPLVIDGKFAMDLPVEYQWEPTKCIKCLGFRHSDKNCSRNLKPR